MSIVFDGVLSEVLGKKLLGELLTIVDAASGDKVQRDAIKSLVRQAATKAMNELHLRLDAQQQKGEVGLATKVEATKVESRPRQT